MGSGEPNDWLEALSFMVQLAVPAKTTYVLEFARDSQLRHFDERVTRSNVRGSRAGIPGTAFWTRKMYDAFYRNKGLQEAVSSRLQQWTQDSTHPSCCLRLSQAFEALSRGVPRSGDAAFLMLVILTRTSRWARLASVAGLPGIPDYFAVYRAVTGESAARYVSRMWNDRTIGYFPVQRPGLASWSLVRGSDTTGAARFLLRDSKCNGVIYKSVVPFERSIFDKWVDDSHLLSRYPFEYEIVLGSTERRPIICADEDVEVFWDGRRYSFDDRVSLDGCLR